MEYTVIKDFIDRDTLKQFRAGDTFACLSAERGEELIEKGYLAYKKEEKPKVKKPEPEKPQKKTAKAVTSAKRTVKKKA